MKQKLILSLFFFISIFYFFSFARVTTSYADKLPNCTELKGKIDGTNWPAGATIDVACGGDNGPSGCHGQVQSNLKAGDSFDLNHCSCPPYADGCLKVGQNLTLTDPAIGDDGLYHVIVVGDVWKVPASCTLGDVSNFCSSNYVKPEEVPYYTVPISCQAPPPACNSACTGDQDCTGQVNGCTQCLPGDSNTGKTCQQPPTTPACNSSCNPGNGDQDCQRATDSCTSCNPNTSKCQQPPACNSTCTRDSDCYGDATKNGCSSCLSGKCQKPPPGSTPVPTSPPAACNTPCGTNPSACNGAKDGCTACVSGKCQQPPPGPTTPPPACNTSCSKDSQCAGAKDGCTVCGSGGKCVPAPTPTPAFNENWCTCDGLDTNPASFFPGDNVSFISYGKVEAPYLDRAKVQSMEFYVYRGDATTATRIADSGPITAALESQSSTKNRYKSTWSYKIPTDITKDEIFRVQSKIKCVPQNVLGASTSIRYQPTLIDRVVSFIGYLFGFRSQPVAMDYQATPVPTESAMVNASPTSQVLAAQNSLQIDTFTPAKIIEKSCSIIRFKFGD